MGRFYIGPLKDVSCEQGFLAEVDERPGKSRMGTEMGGKTATEAQMGGPGWMCNAI